MTTQRRAIRLLSGLGLCMAVAVAAPISAQEHAHHELAMPESGLRAELIRDAQQLERKYVALAEAMRGKYGWRPAEGVRSVSEVFMHVAAANFLLPNMAGVQPPERLPASPQEMEKLTDEPAVIEALKHSFMHARHAITRTPDEELDTMTRMFGQDATKRAVLVLIVSHMHEHLGQSIAYARMVGVTPPWSEAAGN